MASSSSSAASPSFKTVVVCGGSNSAHVCCAYFANKGLRTNLFTRRPKQWSKRITVTTKGSSWERKGDFAGVINKISDKAEDVVPEADLILIAAPANAHGPLLKAAAPFARKGVWVGTIFAQGGFDWAVAGAFRDRPGVVAATFGLQNIPWICTKLKYGSAAKIIGPKQALYVATNPLSASEEALRHVTELFDIPSKAVPNFLSLTLTPSNQIIHPARYWAIFRGYDGKRVYTRSSLPAKLYGDFDELSAEQLAILDNELQQIKLSLLARFPSLDLSHVLPIGERVIKQYGSDVADTSSLKQIFATNLGYAGCNTPMVEVSKGLVRPAVGSRLFWEDIPFGLVILKDLALMLGLPTPRIDFMIRWHQQFMDKEYLLPNGLLNAKLLPETGSASGRGLASLEEVVAPSLPRPSSRAAGATAATGAGGYAGATASTASTYTVSRL